MRMVLAQAPLSRLMVASPMPLLVVMRKTPPVLVSVVWSESSALRKLALNFGGSARAGDGFAASHAMRDSTRRLLIVRLLIDTSGRPSLFSYQPAQFLLGAAPTVRGARGLLLVRSEIHRGIAGLLQTQIATTHHICQWAADLRRELRRYPRPAKRPGRAGPRCQELHHLLVRQLPAALRSRDVIEQFPQQG